MITTFFAYLRVSSLKQGLGVSLQEQRLAIERYAELNGIRINRWFEEKRTAAKRGRSEFGTMLSLAMQKQTRGVILHKIDRGARNLRDWADLGELLDAGIQIRIAGETLDLSSRSGRLAADIQAVVAADYVRNLKEEARKGVVGRMRQGLCPYGAPLGYFNRGPGRVKPLDPVRAPFVVQAFELYATGSVTLFSLEETLFREGFRTSNGRRVNRSSLAKMFRNPFYIGDLVDRQTGNRFRGVHRALVERDLFDRVRAIRENRRRRGPLRVQHSHLYSRLVRCASCDQSLVPERVKGRTYYRCHGRRCPLHRCLREDRLEGMARELMPNSETATLPEVLAFLQRRWLYDGTALLPDRKFESQTPFDEKAYRLEKGWS